MASFVPFYRWVVPSVLGSSGVNAFHNVPTVKATSRACAPPEASLTFKPRPWHASLVDPKATPIGTSLELLRPSAFADPTALLFTPLAESVSSALPGVWRRPTPGFGYPLDELSWPLYPWKPLSAPHTLGLRPSELSSSSVIQRIFRPFPPFPRSIPKPPRP